MEPLRSTGDDGRRPIAESDVLSGDGLAERCLGLPEMRKKTKVVIFKPRTSKYAVARLRTSEYAVARLRTSEHAVVRLLTSEYADARLRDTFPQPPAERC